MADKAATRRVVTLANQTRVVQVLNLPAHVVPELSVRMVTGHTVHDTAVRTENGRRIRGGERTLRKRTARVGGSITLQPKGCEGDMVRDLPESVLMAEEVQRAINAWPPRLAAKTATIEERDAAREQVSEAQAEAAKVAAATQKALEEKARTRAKNRGADVDDEAAKGKQE